MGGLIIIIKSKTQTQSGSTSSGMESKNSRKKYIYKYIYVYIVEKEKEKEQYVITRPKADSTIPTYFMPAFRMPAGVRRRLEGAMQSFLWRGADSARGGALVAWSSVC